MSIRTKRLASVIQRDLGGILQQNYQPFRYIHNGDAGSHDR